MKGFEICVICGEFNRCVDGRCVQCRRDLREEEIADTLPIPFAAEESSDFDNSSCLVCGEPLEKGRYACKWCEPKVYEMELRRR